MQKYDVVLLEVYGETGLKREEVIKLLDKINGDEFYPLEIMANHVESCALGFITPKAANELDFDYAESGFAKFIQDIMDDMQNESDSKEYKFGKLNILLTRNI